MPFDIGAVGMSAANTALGTGLGLLLEKHNDRRQLRQQDRLNNQQEQMAKRMGEFNFEQQLKLWNATNFKAQKEQMKAAGLSPGMLYGMSGAGGATTAAAQASTPSGSGAPSGGGEIMGMTSQAMQMSLLKAQKENIEADTKQKLVDADLKGGATKDNIEADTANKVLNGVILDVTGKDMKNKWEQVTYPNRGVEADVHQKQLDAAGAIASNVWDLFLEGKLKEKSLAEVESLLLSNEQSREQKKLIMKQIDMMEENIKGKKLENIILELESKLQTQTGIDRNSPGWLKILGRLFIGLGGASTFNAMK